MAWKTFFANARRSGGDRWALGLGKGHARASRLPDPGAWPPSVEPPVDSESARGAKNDGNRDECDQDTVSEHPDRAAQQTVVHEVEGYDARANPGCNAESDRDAAQELTPSQEGGEHGEIAWFAIDAVGRDRSSSLKSFGLRPVRVDLRPASARLNPLAPVDGYAVSGSRRLPPRALESGANERCSAGHAQGVPRCVLNKTRYSVRSFHTNRCRFSSRHRARVLNA